MFRWVPCQTWGFMKIYSDSAGFNWYNALVAAECSHLAYENTKTIENFLKKAWEFDHVKFINADNTEAFIARQKNDLIISFRGTKGKADWLRNLKLRTVNDGGFGHVHRGFYEAYDVVKDGIRDAVQMAGTSRVFLTGHSLGGAIAMIAAADLSVIGYDDKINSIYTFGQPRTGKPDFRTYYNSMFKDKTFRFVYNDDIVPRLPPGYKHCGGALCFDGSGEYLGGPTSLSEAILENLASTDGHAEIEFQLSNEAEKPELSEGEFQKLQNNINKIGSSLPNRSDQGLTEELESAAEGIIPSIFDHKMSNYIAAIRSYVKLNKKNTLGSMEEKRRTTYRSAKAIKQPRKTVISTRDMVSDSIDDDQPVLVTKGDRKPEQLSAILKIRKLKGWKPPEGVVITSQMGQYLSVTGSPQELDELSEDTNVSAIELSRKAGFYELTESVPYIRGQAVQRPHFNDRGDCSIIGFIDSGVDILHDAFLDDAGNSRILAIWDQGANANEAPDKTPNSIDPKFDGTFGRLYLSDEIMALREAAKLSDAINIDSVLRDYGHGNNGGHGTHVAGIAAGVATGELGDGIAPEAKIIMVIAPVKSDEDTEDPDSLGYSVNHLAASNFLARVASGANAVLEDALPLVINISQGMNAGGHDGQSLFEAQFDMLSEMGRKEGIAVVKSAGNEFLNAGHAMIEPSFAGQFFEWNSSTIARREDRFEFWFDKFVTLEFQLEDPANNFSDILSPTNRELTFESAGNRSFLSLEMNAAENGDRKLELSVYYSEALIQEGSWKLHVTATEILKEETKIHGWVERDNEIAVRFVNPEQRYTLSIPGTAKTVICVGASSKMDPLTLEPNSSSGPTRLKNQKPEVIAPGTNIMSACSGLNDSSAAIDKSGTSMAAPHVAGMIALAFSKRHKSPEKRQHTTNQIRSALLSGVRNFGPYHPRSGRGIVSMDNFFNYLEEIDNV